MGSGKCIVNRLFCTSSCKEEVFERSSISEPLEPEEETLIWSAHVFLDPSLTIRRLKVTRDKVI